MNKVFFTVDVECHDLNFENTYIWGKNDKGEDSGLKKILEMGKKLDIPINFFVDMPEYLRYGEKYLEKIIRLIQEYNQPIFLHLHPNYITNDDKRTFLWQYSDKEQLEILKKGYDIYIKFMNKEPIAFRVGRYGMNENSYNNLYKVMPNVIDFSFLHENGKMCYVSQKDFGATNIPKIYKNIMCIPNSTFLGLNLFGIKKRIVVDASQIRFGELKKFIAHSQNNDFTITMHSWHFIDKVFWNKKRANVNKKYERNFEKYVQYIKKMGYQISNIEDLKFEEGKIDFDYNSGFTLIDKIRSIFCNFFRFQEIAKINKKYAVFYFMFYFFAIIFISIIILLVRQK